MIIEMNISQFNIERMWKYMFCHNFSNWLLNFWLYRARVYDPTTGMLRKRVEEICMRTIVRISRVSVFMIYQWMQSCLCQEVKKAHFVETRYIILFPACFRTFCCSFELSFYYSKSVISSKLKFQAIFPVYFLYGVNLNVSQSLNLCILTRRILQCRLKSM